MDLHVRYNPGKMELARTHGTAIPEGWALDRSHIHCNQPAHSTLFSETLCLNLNQQLL